MWLYEHDNTHKFCYTSWTPECLLSFEAWAKLAQQLLECVPLGIHVHLEPINKELMLLVTLSSLLNYAIWPKDELCSSKLEALWANGAP